MPINLMILSKIAKNLGQEVKIIDYDFKLKIHELEDNWVSVLEKDFKDFLPNIIGITTNCGNYPIVIEISKILKKLNEECLIFLGGPQAGAVPIQTLREYKSVDFIIEGEGERTFEMLIKHKFKNFEDIKGVYYRKNNTIIYTGERCVMEDLDKSPIPDYDSINIYKYIENIKKIEIPVVSIEVGRGCPFNCTFCSTSIYWKRHYRTKSVNRVIEEIQYFYDKGVRNFNFIHDNLTVNKKYCEGLCRQIKYNFSDIKWNCSSRVDNLDIDFINILKMGGCSGIFLGIETGSQSMQKKINKNLNIYKVLSCIKDCIENGISITTSFIIGFPDESVDDMNETLQLALNCKLAGADIEIQILSPMCGTELFNKYYDLIAYPDKILEKRCYKFDSLSIKNDIKENKDIFGFYHFFINKNFDYKFLWICLTIFKIGITNNAEKIKSILNTRKIKFTDLANIIYKNIDLNSLHINEEKISYFDVSYKLLKEIDKLV